MTGISRRTFLGGLAGAAALTAAGCGSSSDDASGGSTVDNTTAGDDTGAPTPSNGTSAASGPSGPTSTSSGGGASPTPVNPVAPAYVPMEGITPDLPGKGNLPSAFFTYPENPISYATAPIGKGDTITYFGPQYGTGTIPSKSPWFQNLDKILGIELKMQTVPGAQLSAKQSAMAAGGDFPDISLINPSMPLGAIEKYFVDLGPYLSGDAGKKYKGLSSIQPIAWWGPTINGKLYGVPQPRLSAGLGLAVRKDLAKKFGVSTEISSGQDLLDMLKNLTDRDAGHWAIGQTPNWALWMVMEMHGIPNFGSDWGEKDGKFTYMYEYPEVKDCLSIVADKMWKAGYFEPDSAQYNQAWFPGGKVLTQVNHFPTFQALIIANPDMELGLIPLPKWEGGGLAVKQLSPGVSGNFAAFNKDRSKEQIEMYLRLADYIAAPMGTTEFLNTNYGKADVSYTMTDGNPILTAAGKADQPSVGSLNYIASQNLAVLYSPGHTDFIKESYSYLETVMKNTQSNAALGLYSATANTPEANTADTKAFSTEKGILGDILYGRKPVSVWDSTLKAWQKAVGNKIRSEYEAAWAKSH